MDPRATNNAQAGPAPPLANPLSAQNAPSDAKTRALRAMEPRLIDMARMIDHLVYMVQHKLHENSWTEFLTHYQLFQSKMSTLLEALLAPTGVGNFLKVVSVVPRQAPPQVPVYMMLSTELGADLATKARELLEEGEFDPEFDVTFQLRRLEQMALALREAAQQITGPPDAVDMSGMKQVQQKRKAQADTTEVAVLGPRSKLRRDVADFTPPAPPGTNAAAVAALGAAAARFGAPQPNVPPVLSQRVPGAHVMGAGERAQLARVLHLVVD